MSNSKKKGNMYEDAIKRWSVVVGCYFSCSYCLKSFQAQMKRQMPTIDKNGKKRGCADCYHYIPHFHEERLKNSLPRTKGDEFIWCCSSSDIYFAEKEWIEKILERVKLLANRTFFFQSKAPSVFHKYSFPENVILGITLETNRNISRISNAPSPSERYNIFKSIDHARKSITIEPIIEFDFYPLVMMITNIAPERVYIGYDSRNTGLTEPSLKKTLRLIECLRSYLPECKIKTKLMREKYEVKI